MDVRIEPSVLKGQIEAIPSKSHGHRLLIASALAGASDDAIVNIDSEDIRATKGCLNEIFKENPQLDCIESGSTLRFLLPVVMAMHEKASFFGRGRLPERPLSPLKEEMESHGVEFRKDAVEKEKSTLICQLEGKMKGGTFTLPGNVSSQFVTGLLMALPLIKDGGRVKLSSSLESKPYVDITVDVLRQFSIKVREEENAYIVPANQKYISPGEIKAEGDWSSMAFWIVANKLGANIEFTGLNNNSPQGDKEILNLLDSREIDASQIPDLVPILAVKAALTEGTTVIKNAARLRIKESDRLMAISDCINRVGGNVTEEADGLIIKGVKSFKGGTVDGHNDHRIVMAMAIGAIRSKEPITIKGAEAINKSYPSFIDEYKKLGGRVYEV